MKEKRKLQEMCQMSRHPVDKRRCNEASRKLKDEIKRTKEETFQIYRIHSKNNRNGWHRLLTLVSSNMIRTTNTTNQKRTRSGPEVIKKKRTIFLRT
jgi:hypothetical protein